MNKPQSVRQALGLTKTQAGQILIGYEDPRVAYNMWARWENYPEKLDRSTRRLLSVIQLLIVARNIKTPGADGALDMIINVDSFD